MEFGNRVVGAPFRKTEEECGLAAMSANDPKRTSAAVFAVTQTG